MENKNTEQLQTDVDYWKDIARKLVDEVKSKNQQIKSLESEVERLKEDNKLIRDELSAETNLRVKDLRVKNTQLVEALRGVKKEVEARQNQAHCYRILLLIDKALSQNNQPEK
jgi:archaellum component FlaC